MRNRISGIAVACSVAALLGATGTASALEIAMVHSNAAAQSDQRTKAGFEAWIEENGKTDWNVSYLDSGGSGEATASNIQDAASRGVDAIVMTMADLRASRAALDAAKAANIPVFAADSGYVEGIVVDVTTNNWAMSSDVSVYLLDQMGGEGNLVFFRMAEHHGTRKRGDVMASVLKEYPGVKVLAEHNIDYNAFFEDTSRTMEDYAARFGADIDAVWAPWDEPAQAVVNVLNAQGLTDVKVIGIDGHPQAVAEVCKPESQMIATVGQPFEKMGGQIAEWIQAIVVDGKPAAEVIPTKTVYMDAPLITKQNCQEFLQ
ncbi:substrate-binding domain-containing protein [Paracoccus sp. SY]|uniref:sugar ABC transporter substrate-binding protein n=1 Tax=Paracoccus sp. SY TaxID=1330255 RepID=UPI000CD2E260|nr:substrate-binding domain-containing protein [Paracoccus sp. SY]